MLICNMAVKVVGQGWAKYGWPAGQMQPTDVIGPAHLLKCEVHLFLFFYSALVNLIEIYQ